MDPKFVEYLATVGIPAWATRASNPYTPSTEYNETVKSGSSYSDELGGEVLYPTIRLGKDGKLYHPEDPFGAAVRIGDYVLFPGPPSRELGEQATAFSKYLSNEVIARERAQDPGGHRR